MPKKKPIVTESQAEFKPAESAEDRESQMIALAVNLAEKQLREGTASSQVITHYLKMASERERIEKEMLKQQEELTKAKIENLQTSKRIEELYANALEAMRSYKGL